MINFTPRVRRLIMYILYYTVH